MAKINDIAPFSDEDKLVAGLAEALALACGLNSDTAKLISDAAALHDVGKIRVSKHIIFKPGRLSPDEFDVMKMHTVWGAKILSDLHGELRIIAMNVSAFHHEKWDGTGYWGFRGDEFPYYCQIVSACDIYYALTMPRPYKEPWSQIEALDYIKNESDRTFCPNIVKAFQSLFA